MRIEEGTGPRAKIAQELLSAGDHINFQGLGLQILPSRVLSCRVFTQWAPENANLRTAEEEFTVGREKLAALIGQSTDFAALLQPLQQKWELLFDYGQGAILLCRQENSVIAWEAGFPK